MNQPDSNNALITIWDVWTRLFHWSLAVAVIFLLVSGNTSFLFFEWHKAAGEFVLALLVFRLIWGIVGSSNVKLASLISHPGRAASHFRDLLKRDVSPTRGNNAAGGWAIVIMLILLLTQAGTGMLIADEDELVEGAFYGLLSSDASFFLYDIHHMNAELIMAFVIIHVAMIFVYWLYAKTNLILPMISGRMSWPSNKTLPSLFIQRWWIGLICLAGVLLVFGYYLGWSKYL